MGWMRKCAPGGGDALNWSQNSGGWSPPSHPPSVPRGENTRSLARVASSSRRMPAIRPSKPYLASASFSPSVLRAADRAAGGKVGSMVSSGGAGPTFGARFPSFPVAAPNTIHLGKFLAGIDVQCRERHASEEGLARQPDHDIGILAQRPQQRELLQPREGLSENVDALGLEPVQMIHGGRVQASIGGDLLRAALARPIP